MSRQPPRAFFEKEVTPNVDKYIDQHHVDHDLWHKAGELGPLCLSIPGEYGGGGGTFAHEAVLMNIGLFERQQPLLPRLGRSGSGTSRTLSAAMPAFFGRYDVLS